MPTMSSAPATMPSPCRNPAASSKSAPGVRMVTAAVCRLWRARTRISSGSSVASRSERLRDPAPSNATTRVGTEEPGRSDTEEVQGYVEVGGEGPGWLGRAPLPFAHKPYAEGCEHPHDLAVPGLQAREDARGSRAGPDGVQG